jgi:hypothetical protein
MRFLQYFFEGHTGMHRALYSILFAYASKYDLHLGQKQYGDSIFIVPKVVFNDREINLL